MAFTLTIHSPTVKTAWEIPIYPIHRWRSRAYRQPRRSSKGNSFFHRMDAVTKLQWLLVVTVTVLLAYSLAENVFVFIYCLFLTALILAGQHPLRFGLRLLPISIVGIWLLVVMSLF
jgi:energy-coupling factor transporter transmembrane protein EcfT